MKRIGVVDGQGGGIGSVIIKRLKETFGESVEIIALGTNAIATAQMLKAKANRGASGENAIVQTVSKMDLIIGTVGIMVAHAMMGELTPRIAEAVAQSDAPKVLLPLNQEGVAIVGTSGAGKSTLLGLLAGLDEPSSGQVWLAGEELTAMDEDGRAALRAERVGFVFQSFHLVPSLNALENVMLPLELAGESEGLEQRDELVVVATVR